jgi:hypothetical protein
MLCSILVRRLKEGASYEDFHRAWFPDQGFGVPARVRNARRVDDPRDLLSVGFLDLPSSTSRRDSNVWPPRNGGAMTGSRK